MTAGPQLLLVEDDDTSATFLAQALALLPARVDVAGSIREARQLALSAPHALWIIDAHLPDGSGLDCLQALARLRKAPALAITAGAPPAELAALRAGGFVDVLMKPVAIAALQDAVRRVLAIDAAHAGTEAADLHPPLCGKQPVWEQQRALAAIGGNAASLAKLRQIFLAELPAQCVELALAQAGGDARAVAALLHKLRASCGFVGAARLAQAVEGLSTAPLDAEARRRFDFAAEDTLATAPQP